MTRFKTLPLVSTLAAGILALTTAGFIALSPAEVQAHDYKLGTLEIVHPVAKITIPGRPGAAFMTINNAGSEADRLVSATSPSAERIELHTHLMEDGVMKMREVEAIDVPANGAAELKPGGLHIMMFGLKAETAVGDMVPITLTFEKAGSVEVEALVADPASMETQMDHSGHSMPKTGSGTTN